MKKINLRSFKVKFTFVLILAMLFAGAMSNFLIYKFSLTAQFNQLSDKLKVIAQTAALMVDSDLIGQVPLNHAGINSAPYKIIVEKLKKIREVNPPIKYIYTMTKTDQAGRWQFVVDPDIVSKDLGKKDVTSYPGDLYNAGRFPEMLKAFAGPSSDKKLYIDEWGVTLSGYAPIRDNQGKAVAMLGVDILADDVYNIQKEVRRRALLVLILSIVLSIGLGMLISGRVTNPIKKLVEGTSHLADGNLEYRVEVKGNDELSDLARSFNNMAVNLSESRRNLRSYFCRTVQSLVRILEARDHYTRGHSEKVAEYAEKIVSKIGFDREKAELIREAAVLHDIGKLGVEEKILNKKEKLTEAEWEAVKQHPIVGGEILKPVLVDGEMLAIIRGHHERYDGKGYPDEISGENIHLFAQILAVTDAYDAMTSSRAYRPALSKEEAIAELKKNSGSQFNADIVKVFLQVLAEEKET